MLQKTPEPVDVDRLNRIENDFVPTIRYFLPKWHGCFDKFGKLKIHPADLLGLTRERLRAFKVIGFSPGLLEKYFKNRAQRIQIQTVAAYQGVLRG